jgi:hypothetical protein
MAERRSCSVAGFEALEAMRESDERTPTVMRRDHDNQIDLLKSFTADVRKRVERVEPPKRRRRS